MAATQPKLHPALLRLIFINVFMGLFPFIFLLRDFRAEVPKNVPEQEFLGAIWLIGWLCERAFRSRLTLREEGQVELPARDA
jgi:hypothetical protein